MTLSCKYVTVEQNGRKEMNKMKKIIECEIVKPSTWWGKNQVHVTYEDETKEMLFDYYRDELSFSEEEFIGLTRKQGHDLFIKRNKEYLLS